jgi:hypothetical protein
VAFIIVNVGQSVFWNLIRKPKFFLRASCGFYYCKCGAICVFKPYEETKIFSRGLLWLLFLLMRGNFCFQTLRGNQNFFSGPLVAIIIMNEGQFLFSNLTRKPKFFLRASCGYYYYEWGAIFVFKPYEETKIFSQGILWLLFLLMRGNLFSNLTRKSKFFLRASCGSYYCNCGAICVLKPYEEITIFSVFLVTMFQLKQLYNIRYLRLLLMLGSLCFVLPCL